MKHEYLTVAHPIIGGSAREAEALTSWLNGYTQQNYKLVAIEIFCNNLIAVFEKEEARAFQIRYNQFFRWVQRQTDINRLASELCAKIPKQPSSDPSDTKPSGSN